MGDVKDVLDRLDPIYPTLTPQLRRIADFILDNFEEAAFLNTNTLAQRTGTSKATVVRFAKVLGYPNFGAMQLALAGRVRRKLSLVDRLASEANAVGNDSGPPTGAAFLQASLKNDQKNLEETLGYDQTETFQTAVDALVEARSVLTVGGRTSYVLAYFAWVTLSYARGRTYLARGDGENFLEEILHLGPGDVLLAYTFQRYSRRSLQILDFARSRQATTLVFTDRRSSPAKPYADILMVCPVKGIYLVESLVAPLALTQALVAAVAARNPGRTKKTLQVMERELKRFGVLSQPHFELAE